MFNSHKIDYQVLLGYFMAKLKTQKGFGQSQINECSMLNFNSSNYLLSNVVISVIESDREITFARVIIINE